MADDARLTVPQTLTDLLTERAATYADKVAFAYSIDGEAEPERLTYRELDIKARAIAATLQRQGAAGERVLVLCPSGLDFIATIFGCFYAGTVAIPVHPPVHSRLIGRVASIVADSQARFVLTTSEVQSELKEVVDALPDGGSLQWYTVETVDDSAAEQWVRPDIGPASTAFVQYTSGSTGTPKGVELTHHNLLVNVDSIARLLGKGDQARVVSWLPLHHDMGLIGCIFGLVYFGGTAFLMPPSAFIQRPMRWLEAISRTKANISVAPNFGYELCVERSTPEERAAVDLSEWSGAFTGAEPVRVKTMQRFSEAFAPAGFQPEYIHAVYGLAEATLLVAGAQYETGSVVRYVDGVALRDRRVVEVQPDHAAAMSIVGCGTAAYGQRIVIADPVTRRQCDPDEIGEIWVAGENVAKGYWHKPAETEETFAAYLSDSGDGPFLRTGDLGFFVDDELFISGRHKDLVIIRGRNYYPNDIEFTVQETHPGLMNGRGAVFAITPESGGTEQLVVVQEVDRERISDADVDDVIGAIRTAVTAQHEIQAHAVLLADPLRIPTTSSGKIRRRACKQKFLDGQLEAFAEWHAPVRRDPQPDTAPPAEASPAPEATERPRRSAEEIAAWFAAQMAAELGLSPAEIDTSQPFAYYGLDSVRAIQLMTALETWLGCKTSPTLAYDYPTIDLLAGHLAGETDDATAQTRTAATALAGAAARPSADEPIAIIGIGCRFPGADGPAAFWRLLTDGVDAVTEVPASRWNADAWAHSSSRWGGFLDQVDRFDAQFFGISPREAMRMDPQQRLLMEVAWEALEDAGQVPDRLAGSRTGVFAGVSGAEYQHLQLSRPDLIDAYSGTGVSASIAANRLSYFFDFRGPSMVVDTACSSSLVAVHLACRSLRDGECSLALAAGVNVVLSPAGSVNFTKAGVMAADGRCKTFDAGADGWVRGEGAGVVVLKPLSQALADGDPIYAVIRGTAVNQDGRTNGLMAPSRSSQEEVLAEAYHRAGLSPGAVGYVEAQGLGTLLGDTIEAEALGSVLAEGRTPESPCLVGSVKTNIGHLEAASGVAGLIKVALSLRNRAIPPTLHYTKPNPNIPFDELQLQVVKSLTPWPDTGGRAVAGVSAFGFGGTNAHVVLAEAPHVRVTDPADDADDNRVELLPLSARSPEALAALAHRYELALEAGAPLGALCHTASVRRTHHDHRLAVVGSSRDEVSEALAAFRRGVAHPGLSLGRRRPGQRQGVVFLFSGEGSHWCGMGRSLYDDEPVFRDALATCDRALRPYLDGSTLTELLTDASDSRLDDDVDIIAAAVFATQVALAALWRSWGIEPAAVVGHGLGEVAAAHVAGAIGLDDAAQLVCARTRAIRRTSDRTARAFLKDVLDTLSPATPRVPVYSTVTGGELTDQLLEPAHWMANIASPVALSTALRRLLELGSDTFLEISPHPVLVGAVRDHVDSSGEVCTVVSSIRSDEPARTTLIASLGALYGSGAAVAWDQVHRWGGGLVAAPTYPWQRERFWLDDDIDRTPAPEQADSTPPRQVAAAEPAQAPVRVPEVGFDLMVGRADLHDRRRLLESYLRDQAADKLGMTPSLLDIASPLHNLGVDSLMASELRTQIERDLGIVVPVVELLDGPTVSSLAGWLSDALSAAGPAEPNPPAAPAPPPDTRSAQHDSTPARGASDVADARWIDLLTQVPEVSDDDVDALLREVLTGRKDQDD